MFEIFLIAVIALPLPMAIVGIALSSGKIRREILITNGVILAVAAVLALVNLAHSAYTKPYSEQYSSLSSGLLSSVTYEGTREGCHLFNYGGFLTSESYAVPDSVKLPLIAHIYDRVTIYYEKDSELGGSDGSITIGTTSYQRCTSVKKIVTNLFSLDVFVIATDYAALFIYNLIMFIYVVVKHTQNKRKPSEQI